jgi:hypothetical protein
MPSVVMPSVVGPFKLVAFPLTTRVLCGATTIARMRNVRCIINYFLKSKIVRKISKLPLSIFVHVIG